jgi:transcriptional regulator with XRE-family HTH domain
MPALWKPSAFHIFASRHACLNTHCAKCMGHFRRVIEVQHKPRQSSSRAPTRVDQLVGGKIRALRIAQNRTLAELGAELGISHQQLQKYETGTNRLSAGMLSTVAEALRVPIADLFEDDSEADSVSQDPSMKVRAECHDWIDRTKSTEKLETMARVLKALSSG